MSVRVARPLVLTLAGLVLMAPLVLRAQPQRPQQQRPAAQPRQDLALVAGILPQTDIENLLAQPGAMIVKDAYRIGTRTTFGTTVDAIIVTEMTPTSQRLKGLRIDLGDPDRPPDQAGSSFLDYDEAVALSRTLGSMPELASKWTRDDRRSTDVTFTTLGGFVVSMHYDGRNQRASLVAGRAEVIRTNIEVADFATLKNLVDEALTLLGGK